MQCRRRRLSVSGPPVTTFCQCAYTQNEFTKGFPSLLYTDHIAMSLRFTPLDEIPKIHARLSKTFDSGKTLPLEYRRSQLLALARMTQENTDALLGALYSDLGRHKLEGNLPEIGPIVATCIMTANALEEWTKPEKPQVEEWRANWDTTIHKAPKGLVVNIR